MAVPEDDQRVHQNLVRMMDRRLSNVQLQQHFYEEQRHRHRHSNGSSGVSSPRRSIDRSGQEQRRSILQQPRSSVGAKSSNGGSVGGAYENLNGGNNDRYAGYYLGYVGQAAHKRRRTTFWETLTGLVCSLGALASRAAKMAARRGDPL
ncbi:hypothetical protein EAG_03561 [Camponotus floridanus]|uniref:Uncharacterized protein n=1 Tax=Camponotus floridanus TaxID=104421 RepID=E2AQ14_CAMFO|nr:hypothetical protein EAG_03561 [Camponotus floridanus]